MNQWLLLRRLRGPAFLVLIGIMAMLAEFHVIGFHRSWPLLLVLAGVLSLAERAALSRIDPTQAYPGQAYPGQPYAGQAYAGPLNPGTGYPGYPAAAYPAPVSTPGSTALTPHEPIIEPPSDPGRS